MVSPQLFQEIPDETDLEIICDFRQGDRPEIVIPMFNEAKRLSTLHEYYKHDFDLVILEGGSTDATVKLAKALQITVFRRRGVEAVGDNHFVLYANKFCKSGLCGYFYADEYVDLSELIRLFGELRATPKIVQSRRIDWLFGKRLRSVGGSIPRLFSKGTARYNSAHIHGSLASSLRDVAWASLDVHHLHIWNMEQHFGTQGSYALSEVNKILADKHAGYRFAKRFIVGPPVGALSGIIHGFRLGPALIAWILLWAMMRSTLGILALLAQKYLPSPEEQLQKYLRFYKEKHIPPRA